MIDSILVGGYVKIGGGNGVYQVLMQDHENDILFLRNTETNLVSRSRVFEVTHFNERPNPLGSAFV